MRWRARSPQLKRDPLGRRNEPGGFILLGKSVVLESSVSAETLLETLQRAASSGDMRRVPDSLRAEQVDALVFSIGDDGRFRIVPEGLYDGWRPRIDIEGRGRVLRDSAQAKIQFEVGLDASSLTMLATVPTVLVSLALFNLIAGSSSPLAFWGLCGFAGLLAAVMAVRGRALVRRAWPGLLVVVRRLAEGTLYVPAA